MTITPPPELVQQWENEALELWVASDAPTATHIAARAAQWGADQELEACNNWLVLNGYGEVASKLRAARRPKPPSLKERALNALSHLIGGAAYSMDTMEFAEYIRQALEQLPDE